MEMSQGFFSTKAQVSNLLPSLPTYNFFHDIKNYDTGLSVFLACQSECS